MTISVNPERPTLSLPGARLRSDEATVRAGPNGVSTQSQRTAPAITVSKAAAPDAVALRAATSGLDRASSVTDTASAAANQVVGLLGQLRDAAAAERGADVVALLGRIDETARGAVFDGVNLLDGSTPGGVFRLATDGGGSEMAVAAPDLRTGGPLVTIGRDTDPASALGAAEASLANAEAARDGLREDSKRVEAHRAFVGLLSDAVAGGAGSLDIDNARLAALSVKQALEGATLSLSNGAPKTVLSLFR